MKQSKIFTRSYVFKIFIYAYKMFLIINNIMHNTKINCPIDACIRLRSLFYCVGTIYAYIAHEPLYVVIYI